jgi:cyclopropane fatty-acyl-phospholipid synthase-like methyltransferase
MYVPGRAEAYLQAGLSASICIEAAVRSARMDAPATILDFPCGYGRVLRFLRIMFPDSEIAGAELQEEALKFCGQTFRIATFQSSTGFHELNLPRKFDLIWCGSLLTHLDEPNARDLLRFFHRHLSKGGLCIFTTHGERPARWIAEQKQTYTRARKVKPRSCASFASTATATQTIQASQVTAFPSSRPCELVSWPGKWVNGIKSSMVRMAGIGGRTSTVFSVEIELDAVPIR